MRALVRSGDEFAGGHQFGHLRHVLVATTRKVDQHDAVLRQVGRDASLERFTFEKGNRGPGGTAPHGLAIGTVLR